MMTVEEADEILEMKDRHEGSCCSCHTGNPPCSYCTDMPNDEDIEEAETLIAQLEEREVI